MFFFCKIWGPFHHLMFVINNFQGGNSPCVMGSIGQFQYKRYLQVVTVLPPRVLYSECLHVVFTYYFQ